VPELSPPVANWTQLHSRESFNFGDGPSGSISLFDLIKVSLRYRPDYVIVGEVRGEEAYVLFQALATGHGGLCTMHADSIDRVVKRLTSPPMNVSEVYIPLMNIALYIQRVELPNRTVSEIAEYDNYIEVSRWDPRKDVFNTWFKDSFILQQISTQSGMSMKDILEEIDRRERYIEEIVESGVRNQSEVAERILSYYNRQRDQRADGEKKTDVEEAPVPLEEEATDLIDMLKDASSSMLEDIVAQPPPEQEPGPVEIEEQAEIDESEPSELEPIELEAQEIEPAEPEVTEQDILEIGLEDELSTLNDLVKEQENELDFATKVLWELAQDASQLVNDNKLTDDAHEAEAEEVQQG